LLAFVGGVAGVLLVSRIASWPFTRAFASDYTGFDVWQGQLTPTALFLEVSGMWVYAALSAAVLLLIRVRWLSTISALIVGAGAFVVLAIGIYLEWPALWIQAPVIVLMGTLVLMLLQRHHLWQISMRRRRAAVQLELPVFDELHRAAQPNRPAIALETIFTVNYGVGHDWHLGIDRGTRGQG
jgi:hypothetical protein